MTHLLTTELPFLFKSPCTALATNGDETLYLGHENGDVVTFDRDFNLISHISLGVNPITTLSCYPGGFLAATRAVIQLFRKNTPSDRICDEIGLVAAVASRYAFVIKSKTSTIEIRLTAHSSEKKFTIDAPEPLSQIAINDTHVAALTSRGVYLWAEEQVQPQRLILPTPGEICSQIALSPHSVWILQSSHTLTQYPIDHQFFRTEYQGQAYFLGSNGVYLFFQIPEINSSGDPTGHMTTQWVTDTQEDCLWSYLFSESVPHPLCHHPHFSIAGKRMVSLSPTSVKIYEERATDKDTDSKAQA